MDRTAINQPDLEIIATACRRGLSTLAFSEYSLLKGFPGGACGPASEILGRALQDFLQYEGYYICGSRHSSYKREATHAWVEVGDYIIDITHDQFEGAGLSGWVFYGGSAWHLNFEAIDKRKGFSMPSK